ncbi:MAG: hypothetical protein LBQ30_09310 [Treponema sp.]|nr:hypothetical protein [Treponema sp.]
MKQKQSIIFIAALFLGVLFTASADIGLSIRYFDKRIYYVPGTAAPSGSMDPIYVQVTITNDSPSPFRFKLADERVFSIDFEVRTMSNRLLDPAPFLLRKRSQSQQVYFREISIASGESFSFVENLRDYADLQQSGSFIVQARMYPELYRTAAAGNPVHPLESNRLSLSLRPRSLIGPDGIPLEMDVETNAVLVREKLSPDEVVKYMLSARQKSQWEKFFLYLDLESMLTRDGVRQRQWIAESEEGRRQMIARYRTDLQSSVVDGDIAIVPSEFQIERTNYNEQEGTVIVLEKFKIGPTVTERKRYTYYVRRTYDIWTIVDYTVVNLGTE